MGEQLTCVAPELLDGRVVGCHTTVTLPNGQRVSGTVSAVHHYESISEIVVDGASVPVLAADFVADVEVVFPYVG